MKHLLSIMVLLTLLACNSSDCNNGIQDGNETGIDCGGDCTACATPSTLESQLAGDWYLHYTVYTTLWDTTWSNQSPDCKIHLSLDLIGNNTYSAYGTIGSCAYTEAFESSWYLDQDDKLNGSMDILLLTSDSLYLDRTAQSVRYIYYR